MAIDEFHARIRLSDRVVTLVPDIHGFIPKPCVPDEHHLGRIETQNFERPRPDRPDCELTTVMFHCFARHNGGIAHGEGVEELRIGTGQANLHRISVECLQPLHFLCVV